MVVTIVLNMGLRLGNPTINMPKNQAASGSVVGYLRTHKETGLGKGTVGKPLLLDTPTLIAAKMNFNPLYRLLIWHARAPTQGFF